MTNRQKVSLLGVVALFAAAEAMHWLITPMSHPDASAVQTTGVYVMFFGGIAVAFKAWKISKASGQLQ